MTVELTPVWKAEIEDRIGQVERGEVEPVAWEQVEAKIRATLAPILARPGEVGSRSG